MGNRHLVDSDSCVMYSSFDQELIFIRLNLIVGVSLKAISVHAMIFMIRKIEKSNLAAISKVLPLPECDFFTFHSSSTPPVIINVQCNYAFFILHYFGRWIYNLFSAVKTNKKTKINNVFLLDIDLSFLSINLKISWYGH